jgi:hypothetical protein
MRSKILSIYANAIADKASGTADHGYLLHFAKMEGISQVSDLLVECTVPKTNNLSAAMKNRTPHFQYFAFFC